MTINKYINSAPADALSMQHTLNLKYTFISNVMNLIGLQSLHTLSTHIARERLPNQRKKKMYFYTF